MINSKNKGKRGELEIVRKLKEYGYLNAQRSVQYCGVNGDADVIGLPGIHAEIKRVERLNIQDAMSQAIADCKEDMPTVMHRKNNCEWLVTMRLSDWIELYKEWKI